MQRLFTAKRVDHKLLELRIGNTKIQTSLLICIELFLVFGSTELVFVALESDMIDDATCDFRHKVPHLDNDLVFDCRNRLTQQEFHDVLKRQLPDIANNTILYLESQYQVIDTWMCPRVLSSWFLYMFIFCLFGMLCLTFFVRMCLSEASAAAGQMGTEKGVAWSHTQKVLQTQVGGAVSMFLITGFCIASSSILSYQHNPASFADTTYCHWEDKIIFANTMLWYFNICFCSASGIMSIYMINVYRVYHKNIVRLLAIFGLLEEWEEYGKTLRFRAGCCLKRGLWPANNDRFWHALSQMDSDHWAFDPLTWSFVVNVERTSVITIEPDFSSTGNRKGLKKAGTRYMVRDHKNSVKLDRVTNVGAVSEEEDGAVSSDGPSSTTGLLKKTQAERFSHIPDGPVVVDDEQPLLGLNSPQQH